MKTQTISDDDPMKKAILRIFGKIDRDEFICPGLKGVDSIVTASDCELKGRGAGCSELKSCPAYQKRRAEVLK